MNGSNSKCCWRYCGIAVDRSCCLGISCALFTVIALLLTIVLVAVSIKNVAHNDLAIVVNAHSKEVDSDILEEGRHTLYPGATLHTFPRKFVTINDQISCLSKDGLHIDIRPTVQYQYIKERLMFSFRRVGNSEELREFNRNIAETALRDACSNFTAQQFYTSRGIVEANIATRFNELISQSKLSGGSPGFVQMDNFQLPSALLEAISESQRALEDVDIAESQRDESLILARTAQIRSAQQNAIKLIEANTDVSVILFQANQQSLARQNLWNQLGLAILSDITNLNISPIDYVETVLLPKATVGNLDAKLRSCLQNCASQAETESHCWYCWVNAIPSVSV